MKKKDSLEDIYNEFMGSSDEKEVIEESKEEKEVEEMDDLKIDQENSSQELEEKLKKEIFSNEDFDEVLKIMDDTDTKSTENDLEDALNQETFSNEDFDEGQKITDDTDTKSTEKDLEDALNQEIFSNESFNEVEKIIKEVEDKNNESDSILEGNNFDKKIKIAIIVIIALLILVLLLLFIFKNKDDGKPNEKTSNSSPITSSNVSELPYSDVMEMYGNKVIEQLDAYYLENQKLPEEIPTVELEGYTIVCEEIEIYNKDTIYLGVCTINGSEEKYSYGNAMSEVEVVDTNSNSNENTNTNSNSETNTNSTSNKTSNKTSNTNSSSNTSSNTNKTSNSNTQTTTTTNPTPTVSSSGTRSEVAFGKFSIIPSTTPIAGEHPGCKNPGESIAGCYGNKLVYKNGALMLTDSTESSILMYNFSDSQAAKIQKSYSLNITLNGDVNQYFPSGNNMYASAIVGISPTDNSNYLWLGYKAGKLYIQSYGAADESIDISGYNNSTLNIQITAEKGGNTNVYVNGVLKKTFASGNNEMQKPTFMTIGDLRPGRMIRYKGYIYEVEIYDKVLTKAEIDSNFTRAKSAYSIK